MTGKTKQPSLHSAILLCVIIVVFVFGCAHTEPSIVSIQREKIADIPSGWRSAVILLENRTELSFEVHKGGNRVRRKDTIWAYVRKRNPNNWERIALFDYETKENTLIIGRNWATTICNFPKQRMKVLRKSMPWPAW
jgi:hypothetical protein